MKKLFTTVFLALILLCGCAQGGSQEPRMGHGGRPDKSGDATLNQLKSEVLPKFRQFEFNGGGLGMKYSLFAPAKIEPGKKYPLVMFIADASTAGKDVMEPLTQGYGALVWATAEAQAKNPCFVLVPQFSRVAVNDAYEHSPEVDAIPDLLASVVRENPVDTAKIYSTGQSMGGMIGMYLTSASPGIFAASLFVDCHWDQASFNELVQHPFIFVAAGHNGKAWPSLQGIEEACRKDGISYTWAEWSARLPLAEQDDLAATMLAKGQPVNLISFENGTVLPEGVQGSEHMYSFDHAYQIAPLRDWLFKHSLKNSTLLK